MSPSRTSTQFTTPYWLYIQFHMSPATANDVMTGT